MMKLIEKIKPRKTKEKKPKVRKEKSKLSIPKILLFRVLPIILASALLCCVLVYNSVHSETGMSLGEMFSLLTADNDTDLETEKIDASKLTLGSIGTINNEFPELKKVGNIYIGYLVGMPIGSIIENKNVSNTDDSYKSKIITDYNLEDFYKSGKKVKPYDIFYATYRVDGYKIVSFLCCNNTDKEKDAKDCNIIAIGVDYDTNYYAYNNLKVGSTIEQVHDTFKGNLKNCNTLDGYETYIDNDNNFVYFIFEEDKVISFMTGNTLGEPVIVSSITK